MEVPNQLHGILKFVFVHSDVLWVMPYLNYNNNDDNNNDDDNDSKSNDDDNNNVYILVDGF